MNRVRVRFGIRLGWPIRNAATFVFYASREQFARLEELTGWLKTALAGIGQDELAGRLFCEES